jgi:hypothetical protein
MDLICKTCRSLWAHNRAIPSCLVHTALSHVPAELFTSTVNTLCA